MGLAAFNRARQLTAEQKAQGREPFSDDLEQLRERTKELKVRGWHSTRRGNLIKAIAAIEEKSAGG